MSIFCLFFADPGGEALSGALPYGVTAHSRTDGETVYVFLQNFTAQLQETETSRVWRTVEDGEPVSGRIALAPYGTLILARKPGEPG